MKLDPRDVRLEGYVAGISTTRWLRATHLPTGTRLDAWACETREHLEARLAAEVEARRAGAFR